MSITILAFTPGTTIASTSVNANFNAIKNALAGVNSNNFLFASGDNVTSPLTVRFASQPTIDAALVAGNLPSDGGTRIDMYIDGTYGQYTGGIRSGDGTTLRARLLGYYGGNATKLQQNGWRSEGAIWTDGFGVNANGLLLYGDPTNTWSVWDGQYNLSFRINGTHAFAATTSNTFVYSGSNYGFIGAGASVFNVTSTYADVAEPLLTGGGVEKGMAVCLVGDDTVGPCVHDACRIAKIVSTNPSMLLAARMQPLEQHEQHEDGTTHFMPMEGHESAQPLVVGGIAPVKLIAESQARVKLGDRITTAGNVQPGMCRVATAKDYAFGDVVSLKDGVAYAWIHY